MAASAPRTGDHLTPAQVSRELGVSAATLRRHAQVYEELFGALPRERDQRRWTPEAVRHLRVAQQAVSTGLVVSLEVALTRVRDGQDLPDYEGLTMVTRSRQRYLEA